jgi:hypothetical protein
MAIRYDDGKGGVIVSGGLDPKLKRPLVDGIGSGARRGGFGAPVAAGKDIKEKAVGDNIIDRYEEEIRLLKRENQEKGSRIVELERHLSEERAHIEKLCAKIVSLEAVSLAPSKGGPKPWEERGISKATYYNRKRDGKL